MSTVPVGKYLSSAPTLSDGDTANLRLNSSGELMVNDSASGSGASSSTGGGANTYTNDGNSDFTATANSGAKTITFSSFNDTTFQSSITVKNFANAVIKRINSSGDVDTLPLTNIAWSSNVLTLADMTANFAAGDTVSVIITGPMRDLSNLIAGEDLTNDRMLVMPKHSFSHISTATTTVVKSGAGVLAGVTINTTAAGAITIYDNTAASGTVIAILKASVGEGEYLTSGIVFGTGLTVVTAAASDVTVAYL